MHVASSSQGLDQGGSCSRLLSSLSALKALNISMATSTDSDSVDALVRPGCDEKRVMGRGVCVAD
jgi:hypothetical protein